MERKEVKGRRGVGWAVSPQVFEGGWGSASALRVDVEARGDRRRCAGLEAVQKRSQVNEEESREAVEEGEREL